MLKKWQIAQIMPEEAAKEFSGINPVIAQFLYNRGISDREEVKKFSNPCYDADFHDPFLFQDMEKAVERIFTALSRGEKITIFGDYDADGVTATVLLEKTLNSIKRENNKTTKQNISVYIPHRGREGYGLNKEALKYIKENGAGLVITVDCGVSNFEEVEYGNSLGLDIIITDHHQPPAILPKAFAIINPKVEDDQYPFRQLAGVGVAFKLAQGLIQENKKTPQESKLPTGQARKQENKGRVCGASENAVNMSGVVPSKNPPVCPAGSRPPLEKGVNHPLPPVCPAGSRPPLEKGVMQGFEKWLLDLVAVGTIADCCPLIDENRIFAKFGLIVLNKTKNVGLRALIDTALAKARSNSVICSKQGKVYVSDESVKKEKLEISARGRSAFGGRNWKLDAWNVAFQIAPRINAAGRLDHANTAYKLLMTEDEDEARKIADSLDKTNGVRQALTDEAVAEAIEIIEREQKRQEVFFVYEKKWEPGILGLIAGRICERYYKPVFAFTKIGDEIVASGRSIPEFNIIEALREMENPPLFQRGVRGDFSTAGYMGIEKGGTRDGGDNGEDIRAEAVEIEQGLRAEKSLRFADANRPPLEKGVDQPPLARPAASAERPLLENGVKLLKRYGGHAQACGLSLSSEEDFFNFKKKFLEIAEMKLKGEDLFPKIKIDFEIDISDISWELIDDIKNMEPFGEGNPKPLIKLSNLEILDIRIMGNGGKHLKMRLTPPLSQRGAGGIGGGCSPLSQRGAGGDFSTAGHMDIGKEGTRDGADSGEEMRAEAVEIEQSLRAEKSPRFADANRPPLEKGVNPPPIPRFADANRPPLGKGVDQPPIPRLPYGQTTPFNKGGNPSVINAVGFSMNDEERLWGEKLKRGDTIDIAGYIDVNEWNGNKEIQIKVCDLILVKKNDK